MKTQIFLFFLLFLALVSAVTYSGESVSFLIPEQYDYYSIIGNSTPIDLTVMQNGLNITITVDKYQATDNFEVIFFNKEKEIITQTIYTSGGGGSSTKYIDRNITVFEPKFYDRNITNTIEIDKEIIKEVEIESNLIWFYISIFVIVLCIIIGVLYFGLKQNE